jgi:hypothetical protein
VAALVEASALVAAELVARFRGWLTLVIISVSVLLAVDLGSAGA